MTALLICFFSITVPIISYAQSLTDPAQEARAVALGAELRCVVCQSESINDSQADMARDMRRLVRDKIGAGWSDAQIIGYLRGRYGDFILLRPPLQANTVILWLAPVLIFAAGAGFSFAFIARRKGRKSGLEK